MTIITHLRARSLSAVLSIVLTALAASPVIALASTQADCTQTPAEAQGLRDASGRLREPLLTQAAAQELPARAQGRGGAHFSQTVPLYFHVVTNGTIGSVSMTTIAQQMDVLNKGYGGKYGGANTGFKFALADVDFTVNAAWFDAGPGSAAEAEMKQALKQGGPGDVNIYSTSGNLYLGWAYYPSVVGTPYEILDGVVIDFRSLPGGPYGTHYSLGGTLTHEIGHWFGLAHTFDGKCSSKGDLVADTPAERTPTAGCPEGKDTCPAEGLDPIHNYMDYSYDSCYNQLTPGQAARAQDQFLFYRT
jgi:Pregnancy-associated plasma protein-A